jgi:hypothetical protein
MKKDDKAAPGVPLSNEDQAATVAAAEQAIAAAQQAVVDAEREAAERIAAIQQSVADAENAASKRKPRAQLSSMVSVGCRLPNGIVLEHPLDPNNKVELNGLNRAKVVGAGYGVTNVPREFWDMWSSVHKDFGPFKAGAIFSASSESDVAIVAAEVAREKTGFEQMPQNGMGIKPAEKD